MALPYDTPEPTNAQAPKQAPFRHRQVALDWARSRLVNGVSLTPRERHVLLELCLWCGPKVGFEPAPPLRSTDTHPGILDKTGLKHSNYLHIVSRLARKGIIEKVSQGGGSRPRNDGGKMWITHTRWRLLVPSVSLETQPSMDLDFRTEVEKPTEDSRGLSEKPTKIFRGLSELSFNNTSNMIHTSNKMAARPAGGEENDGNESVLFSDQFLQSFIERANRAFDLVCGPHCPTGCEYHVPLQYTHFDKLGGGGVNPGSAEADKIIADTLRSQPYNLVPYLTKCLSNLLQESDRHVPTGIPTLPMHRTASAPEPPQVDMPELPRSNDPRVTERWYAVLGHLESILDSVAYRSWFYHSEALSYEDDVLTVVVQTEFIAEMIKKRQMRTV